MRDTRPLWERALAARGTLQRRRRCARLFLQGSRDLSAGEFVDLVRALVGLRPLHAATGGDWYPPDGYGYVRLEKLRRAADPDCDKCGGSGYYDGEMLGMRCKCTGLPQRTRAPWKHRRVNRDFARVRRV